MYNIAKVAKGEILLFFNDVFDALCKVCKPVPCVGGFTDGYKLAADSELSVKNGAELLDRLVKDIVSESAATYVSILEGPENRKMAADEKAVIDSTDSSVNMPTAFSLPRFIPLLQERIYVLNPFTRTFLVSWVTLLDTIPDLELVAYLPSFLGGLFKFLSDSNRDVHVATQGALERFLNEIKKIAKIRRGILESRSGENGRKDKNVYSREITSLASNPSFGSEKSDTTVSDTDDDQPGDTDDDWIPGQDVQVDYPKILGILVDFLDPASGSGPSCITSPTWYRSY